MAGKTVPWWRRALHYAFEGIRSRFGLFSRPAIPEPLTDPDIPPALDENLEETALTDKAQNSAQSAAPNSTQDVAQDSASASETVVVSSAELAGVSEAAAQTVPVVAEPAPPSPVKSPDLDPKSPPAKDPDEAPSEPPAHDPDPQEPPVTEPPADPENAPAPVKSAEAAPEPAAETQSEESTETGVTPVPAKEPQAVPADAPTVSEPATAAMSPTPDPAPKEPIKPKQRDEDADTSPFSVFVGQVYDGPLDLLLDLIRKQDIDIYDIPIAKITAQFLAYVNQLKASDVDVAGEFIYTASLLIHIKSKMLLPRAAAGPEDAAEDPRRELVERLLEHERFKNAAQMLQQKQMLEAATWTNPGVREFKDDAATEPEIAADTTDLVRIFRDILDRARKRPVFSMDEDQVTVGQMIQFLARRLTMEDKPVALRRLLSHTRSERALIAMFLALLELVRLQAILLRQDRAFSEIFIKKNSEFESVMTERIANVGDDWR